MQADRSDAQSWLPRNGGIENCSQGLVSRYPCSAAKLCNLVLTRMPHANVPQLCVRECAHVMHCASNDACFCSCCAQSADAHHRVVVEGELLKSVNLNEREDNSFFVISAQ